MLPRLVTQRIFGCLGAVVLSAGIGAALICLPRLGNGLAQLSYDLPYLFRTRIQVPEAVIVYVDRASAEALQPGGGTLDRKYHVELLRRLTRDGAKLVFYDVLFLKDHPADAEFAQAIRNHGAVILGGDYQNSRTQAGDHPMAAMRQIRRPNATLREAAAGWGLLKVQPLEFDFGARRIFCGIPEEDSAVWVAARLSNAAITANPQNRLAERWINFYGPAFWLDQVSLRDALAPDGVATNFFRGKAVFVGGHPSLVTVTGERDLFSTPYTRFGRARGKENAEERLFAPGVEMMATSYLNLTRGDWLQRLPVAIQTGIVLLYGTLIAITLLFLRPWVAGVLAVLGALSVGAISCLLQTHHHVWWSWMVPTAVQTPLALVWSVGWQYGVESRRRRQLRKAFAAYVSPHLADRIADSDFNLAPGGQEVEVTVMFTDLEKFTNLAETLAPAEVSRILTSYFESATREVLAQEGTITKYIGDSVMAVWGAPLPDPQQAERAVRAAQGIVQCGQEEFDGRKLHTRIGISTGLALAGNLGSRFRFDYTVVGATVNLASRLEGLNKILGTEILITQATRDKLSAAIPVRFLGSFLVKGMMQPTHVFEVCPCSVRQDENSTAYLAAFEQGLACFAAGNLDQAQACMQKVGKLRSNADGPSKFYLEEIDRRRSSASKNVPWDLVVRFNDR